MSTTSYNHTESGSTISTEQARKKLDFAIHHALQHETNTLVNAPTSLGKSYLIASTPWRKYPKVTGGEPVIHFHQTTQARDEAAAVSQKTGVKSHVLKGREDLCPVAAGKHDEDFLAPGNEKPSTWLKRKCDFENVSFHKAHSKLESESGKLPCKEDGHCQALDQWSDVPRDEDGTPTYDVIHATSAFAKIGKFVDGANVIFDERPTFVTPVGRQLHEHFRRSINDLLEMYGRENATWSELMQAVQSHDTSTLREYGTMFPETQPDSWLFKRGYSHQNAPAIGRALTETEQVSRRRYYGEADGVGVVLDEKGTITVIHSPPDLSDARCIIGLDAHPSKRLWKLNTTEDLQTKQVLSDEDRRRWRRNIRGLHIVQVGNATRPFTTGWKNSTVEQEAASLVQELRHQYGEQFRTCITSKRLVSSAESLMEDANIGDPEVLYFGNLKSRNDFKEEKVGLLIGCIDPGDEYILDRLALCGLHAEPETTEEGNRAFGRGFVGPDSDAAEEFLAVVREDNLAQAAGRYARSSTSNDDAIVYVWSSAIPHALTDDTVPGVTSQVTPKKLAVEHHLRNVQSPVSTKEVAEQIDISDKYAWQVLKEMKEQGMVEVSKHPDDGRVPVYEYKSGVIRPSVDLGL